MEWLNYHHLLYFWTTARLGSVRRAADELHLTQPTVSAQLRALERALGRKLFARSGRTVALTESGQAAFRYAEEIFDLGRELSTVMRGEAEQKRRARFNVGVSDSLHKLTAGRLLEPVSQRSDSWQLCIRVDKLERLAAELAIRRLDLLLTDAPLARNSGVRAHHHLLGECGIQFFGAPDLVRKYHDGFPRSLLGAPLLLPTRGTELRQTLDAWLESQSLRPQIVAESDDSTMLHAPARAGQGLLIVPSVVGREVGEMLGVTSLGEVPEVRTRFFAVTPERRLQQGAAAAIVKSARNQLFAPARS